MDRFGMLIASSVLLTFAFASVSSSHETGVSCKTPCASGCCPHEDAVCCEDGFQCCRHGETCVPHVGICMGLASTESGNFTLRSEMATLVANPLCPGEMDTACRLGCCPYPDAECCTDGNHCCPEGFNCSPYGCESNGVRSRVMMKNLTAYEPDNTVMGRKLKELGVQICPDKLHLCPGTAECCPGNDGEWNCCPKTQHSQQGECCIQYFINVCCPDEIPKCHWWGCWWT